MNNLKEQSSKLSKPSKSMKSLKSLFINNTTNMSNTNSNQKLTKTHTDSIQADINKSLMFNSLKLDSELDSISESESEPKSKSLINKLTTERPKNLKNAKNTLNKNNQFTNNHNSDDTTEAIQNIPIQIKLNELIYPCKDKFLETKVILHPYQMNNDIYVNLKQNLIEQVENKCIKDGYIMKVYKISNYECGVIEPENFTGSATYDVTYFAKICIALRETTIVAKIASYIPTASFALAEFGQIIRIIFMKNERDLNLKNFTIGSDRSIIHNKTHTKIQVGTYVKIQLKSIKFYHHDTVIKGMGYLDDIATLEEIETYSYNEILDSKTDMKQLETQSTMYFNEDIHINDKNIDESFNQELMQKQINTDQNLKRKSNFIEI